MEFIDADGKTLAVRLKFRGDDGVIISVFFYVKQFEGVVCSILLRSRTSVEAVTQKSRWKVMVFRLALYPLPICKEDVSHGRH